MRLRPGPVAALLASLVVSSGAGPAGAARDLAGEIAECETCHDDKDQKVDLPSGESQSIYIDAEAFGRSVHGRKLGCKDCHRDIVDVPHESRPFKSKREFTVAYYEQCKRCHFANYSKSLDSVHNALFAKGDTRAPVCVDCHGAHDVGRAGQPRSGISKMCAKCHGTISAAYAKSVHGRALLEENNPDVPTCTDCHRAHDIADPRNARFHLSTPELCGGCHRDEKRMSKYGLSTKVIDTYLADFHGVTAGLQRDEKNPSGKLGATCVDCHGVHDIGRARDVGAGGMQANLGKACARCHQGASESFPAAWLSHYEPSWTKAPLVYGVKLFYGFFLPFCIAGLILQILLHLWRVVVNR